MPQILLHLIPTWLHRIANAAALPTASAKSISASPIGWQSVVLLKQFFPGCAVTTDMIVGFPGETEAEFAESLAFIRRCGFAAMHVFPYSRRPGTPADQMPGQLGNAIKEARSAAAIAVAGEMNKAFREQMIGTVQQVLFEEIAEEATGSRQQATDPLAGDGFPAPPYPARSASLWTGHAPNSIRVYAPGAALHNRVLPVRITGLHEDGVLGETE